jgi:hypothetical protein
MILSENNLFLNTSTIALLKNFKTPKFNSSKFFKKKSKLQSLNHVFLGHLKKTNLDLNLLEWFEQNHDFKNQNM